MSRSSGCSLTCSRNCRADDWARSTTTQRNGSAISVVMACAGLVAVLTSIVPSVSVRSEIALCASSVSRPLPLPSNTSTFLTAVPGPAAPSPSGAAAAARAAM